MSFFAYVRKTAGVTGLFNFETFPNSMIILFQMCTTAGWSGVFQALINDRPPDCDPTIDSPSHRGDCGNMAIATPFLVSYVIITSLIVVRIFLSNCFDFVHHHLGKYVYCSNIRKFFSSTRRCAKSKSIKAGDFFFILFSFYLGLNQ